MKINNLEAAHITAEPYIGRDALNVIEGEMRQFDTKFDESQIKRFFEQILTGAFSKKRRKVDLSENQKDTTAIDKMDVERDLLKN